jgi:hypothetical protein
VGSRSGGSPPSRWSAGVGVGKAALGYSLALTNSPSGKRTGPTRREEVLNMIYTIVGVLLIVVLLAILL